jgi:hypothetical protein
MATRSKKPAVVERIFDLLWDPTTKTLKKTMVTMGEVQQTIEWANQNLGSTLSTRNPANFLKDMVRGSGANAMWPQKLKDLGWAAEQRTGKGGNSFEFIPYIAGQTEPFPDRFAHHSKVREHKVQSLSLPLATKDLGRDDETYMIQIAVKLAVVETHFALESPIKIQELTHLQVGIKLRSAEVDSLYVATYLDEKDGKSRQLAITAEAKKKGQRVIETQIKQQVRAAFGAISHVDLVIPIAMMAKNRGIYIAEFAAISRDKLNEFHELQLVSEGFYELVPSVRGI